MVEVGVIALLTMIIPALGDLVEMKFADKSTSKMRVSNRKAMGSNFWNCNREDGCLLRGRRRLR